MTKYNYDHTDKENIKNIALHISNDASQYQASHIVAFCLSEGLMKPRGIGLRFLMWFCRVRHPETKGYAVMSVALRRKSCHDLCFEMLNQTLDHMVNGKDRNDPNSVGGFDKEELRKFIISSEAVGLLNDQ